MHDIMVRGTFKVTGVFVSLRMHSALYHVTMEFG